jgi:signal transduction histidine kinase
MNIRAKLTLQFSLIVASILIGFSFAVYWLSEDYRREEFYTRLESRALTTVRLLVTVQEVDRELLRIIDKNSIYALFQEKVLVFDHDNQLAYSSLDDLQVAYSNDLLERIRQEKKVEFSENGNEVIGVTYTGENGVFVVIASAYDRYGKTKLSNLYKVLVAGLMVGILLAVLAGVFFSRQMLEPLAKINEEVSEISAGSLNLRINEGNKRDEMAQLAMNFNHMLERLEAAFAIQQQFVSNASHELRNPLAAITSQLQMVLSQPRSQEEYERVLRSLHDDATALTTLTNGLLNLAQSGIDKQQSQFVPIRVDEALFAAQQELSRTQPQYHFYIEYKEMPDDERLLIVLGNERLLKTAFLNLMDNACKFSPDHTTYIGFFSANKYLDITFKDKGIGIPASEQQQIFSPFFRASNVPSANKGYGIGLSLCKRIVELHGGQLTLEPEEEVGSCFKIRLPLP